MTTYADRRDAVIRSHFNRPNPVPTGCTDDRGRLNYATAALWLNQNVADANAQLAAVRISHVTGSNCGPIDEARANLWLGVLFQPYGLFASDSRHFPGRMAPAAASNLIEQVWSYARRFSKVSRAEGPWTIYDSENHDACAKSFNLLAAQTLKNHFPDRVYSDGTRPNVQYGKWRDHWSNYFDERAKRGFPIEVGSPTYAGYMLHSYFSIYAFAEDPVLRQKAEMILDLYFADYALLRLAGARGGAKSRAYPAETYNARGDAEFPFGMLLFGPEIPAGTVHVLSAATSGYEPPDVVRSLADPITRGFFEYVVRRPGVGPDGWDDTDWHVDPTKSVVDYAWVTPDFILGCAQLDPRNTHVGPSNQNRWQGCIFATSPDALVYPQAAPTSIDRTKDAFLSVQRTNTLITHKRGLAEYPTVVYFAPTLDTIVEHDGWLFVKEGNAYLAVCPATGAYAWMTAAKNKATLPDNRFIKLSAANAPIVMEASRGPSLTFAQFQAEIIANPLSVVGAVLNYTNRNDQRFTFYSDERVPLVNGASVNYNPASTFMCPHLQAGWNVGRITVSEGNQSARYDFTDPAHPTKVVA